VNKEVVAQMNLQSYICVPIIARERALGALSFVTTTPGRKYTQADLTLAELLAKRAAIAMDNALLFRNAQIEIAERELAQQMLKESQERLQAILDNSPTAIYVKDIEGRYTLVNRECEQLLNKTRDKILGSTDFDLFPSDI